MAPSRQRLTKRPLTEQMLCRCVKASRDFFFAPDGVESSDHLVEVVRRDPEVAAWFIEMTSFFSIVGSVLTALACSFFLFRYWDRCGDCGRPLRMWLITQVILQLSQIPVRAVLLASMRRAGDRVAWTTEACILSLTASRAWRISKAVSLTLYGWFVLGVVWWMHSSDCEQCAGITMLVASVLLLSAMRVVVTLFASRGVFAQFMQPTQVDASSVKPATADQVRVLPLVRVASACGAGHGGDADAGFLGNDEERKQAESHALHSTCLEGDQCAVCLSEFDGGEMVRRLPCCHHFHPACIDRWLLQNKKCPLCMHPIDEACGSTRLKSQ